MSYKSRDRADSADRIDDKNEGLRITISNVNERPSKSNDDRAGESRSSRDRARYEVREKRSRSPEIHRSGSSRSHRQRTEDRRRSYSPDKRSSHRRPIGERLGPSPSRHDSRDRTRSDYDNRQYRRSKERDERDRGHNRDRDYNRNRSRDYDRDRHHSRDRDPDRNHDRNYDNHSPRQKVSDEYIQEQRSSRWDKLQVNRWDDVTGGDSQSNEIEGIAPEKTGLAELLGPVLSSLASGKTSVPVEPVVQTSSASKPLKSILKSKRLDLDDSDSNSQSSSQPIAALAAAAANINPEGLLASINANIVPFSDMSMPSQAQVSESLFPIVSTPSHTHRLEQPTEKPSKSLPGLSVYSDEIDEETFLYGFNERKGKLHSKILKGAFDDNQTREFRESSSNNAYPPGSNPSFQSSMTPIESGSPPEEEKPHDPTIENILKSIGFNFDLSKKIQDKKNKERIRLEKEKETPQNYGISDELMTSFLDSSVEKNLFQSSNDTDVSLSSKNSKLDMVNDLIRDAKLNVLASKRERESSSSRSGSPDDRMSSSSSDSSSPPQRRRETTPPELRMASPIQTMTSSPERSPSPRKRPSKKRVVDKPYKRSTERSHSHSKSHSRKRSTSPKKFEKKRKSRRKSNDSRNSKNSDNDSRRRRHSHSRSEERDRRSRSASFDRPQYPVGEPLPPYGYGYPPNSYDTNMTPQYNAPYPVPPGYGPPLGYNIPPPPFSGPPPGYQGTMAPPYGYPGGPPPPFAPPYGPPPTNYGPYYGGPPPQPATTDGTYQQSYVSEHNVQSENVPVSNASNLTVVELHNRKTDSEKKQDKENKIEELSKKAREDIASKMAKKIPKSVETYKESKSSSKKRTVLPPKKSKQSSQSPPPSGEVRIVKAIPIPVLSDEERQKLERERGERQKRLNALEKQLEKLRKQQNEMMRKKARQRSDGHKDPFLAENSKLQDEIAAQISALRKTAEDNTKGILNKTADGNWSLGSVNEDSSKTEKKVKPLIKDDQDFNFVYYDGGNYWCRQCNSIHKTIFDFFQHLHSKSHLKGINKYNIPWLPESLKNPKVEPKTDIQMLPMRGVEMLMPCKAFYCLLCEEFSGDSPCGEEHVKGKSHNEKYLEFLRKEPYYERTMNLDKWSALRLKADDEELAIKTEETPVKREETTIKKDRDQKFRENDSNEKSKPKKDERKSEKSSATSPERKVSRSSERSQRRLEEDRRNSKERTKKEKDRSRVKDVRDKASYEDDYSRERYTSSRRKEEESDIHSSQGLKLSMKMSSSKKEIKDRKDDQKVCDVFNVQDDEESEDEKEITNTQEQVPKELVEKDETRTVTVKGRTFALKINKPKVLEEPKKPIKAPQLSGFIPLTSFKKTEKVISNRKDASCKLDQPERKMGHKAPSFVGKHLSLKRKTKAELEYEKERKAMKEAIEETKEASPNLNPSNTANMSSYDMFKYGDDNMLENQNRDETEKRTIRITPRFDDHNPNELSLEGNIITPRPVSSASITYPDMRLQFQPTVSPTAVDIPLPNNTIPISVTSYTGGILGDNFGGVPQAVQQAMMARAAPVDVDSSSYQGTSTVTASPVTYDYQTYSTTVTDDNLYQGTSSSIANVTPLEYSSSDLTPTQNALAYSASQYASGSQYGPYSNMNYSQDNMGYSQTYPQTSSNFPMPPQPPPFPPFPNFGPFGPPPPPPPMGRPPHMCPPRAGLLPHPMRPRGPHSGRSRYNGPVQSSSSLTRINTVANTTLSTSKPVKTTSSNILTIKTDDSSLRCVTSEFDDNDEDGTPDEGLLPPGVEEDEETEIKKPGKITKPKIALRLKPRIKDASALADVLSTTKQVDQVFETPFIDNPLDDLKTTPEFLKMVPDSAEHYGSDKAPVEHDPFTEIVETLLGQSDSNSTTEDHE